ncbi:hypothetical protein LSH36_129g01121 [Paralvinella palmiformis]|uniref:Uncharacterized protein n=1 Tax=Paralvinella palmiformis TaxID=53620 RepID=A0AAD9JWW4_9ANNE|nr:hypothetical protein LSH36_129g01121 [Paralvinella palmiformis]
MMWTTGKTNLKLIGILATVVVVCSLIAVVSLRNQSALSFSGLTSPGQDIISCRRKAIHAIITSNTDSTRDTPALREAKKCWLESLVFYLSYPLDFGYGSHVIPFLASIWVTDGPILEMGSGWYSTPVAHRISILEHGRKLLTADTKYDWLKYFLVFASNNHRLYYVRDGNNQQTADDVQVVNSWDDIGKQSEHWGMIFLDHAPGERRKVDLERLRGKADLLVIHDSQPKAGRAYKSQKLLATFKHRTTFGPRWSNAYADVVSDSRPDLIFIVNVLCRWSIEALKPLKGI